MSGCRFACLAHLAHEDALKTEQEDLVEVKDKEVIIRGVHN